MQTEIENAILQSTAESLVFFGGEVVESASALDSLDDIDCGQVQQHFPHQLQGQSVQNHWFSLKRTQIHQQTRVLHNEHRRKQQKLREMSERNDDGLL